MSLVCYIPKGDPSGDRLRDAIEMLAVKERPQIYADLEEACQRVNQPLSSSNIFVLMAANSMGLDGIVEKRERLRDVPVILILPDSEKKTIELGHTLYPRFVSYIDSDFKDVAGVLYKMIRRLN
jgi:hypothetical protein